MKLFLVGLSLFFSLAQAQDGAPALRGSALEAFSAPSSNEIGNEVDLNEPLDDTPYIIDRQGRRQLREGGMKPLSCNDSYRTCVNWSDVFGASSRHTSTIIVECGHCIIMDHSQSELVLLGGLDIQGKLIFPNTYSGLTLKSTMIVVQGELEMATRGRIGGTPKVTFEMIGNNNRSFEPVNENARYCDGRTLCDAGKKAIMVAGGRVDIKGIPNGTTTWTKLHDVVGTNQRIETIIVPGEGILNRWDVGAEILITSYTNKGDDEHVRRITAIHSRNGFAHLTLNALVNRPTSERDDPEFAVEVALLSRNIVFRGGPDSVSHHGGHFWIFETSGYDQHVEGVELVNFGQAGTLGRYPLHAHMCGDLDGSAFVKNTIRDSNQRCVVIHATDNFLIEDNVAYNTGGHCYMLEDGMETGNKFIRNLGARTRRPAQVIPDSGTNGIETDREASTFWIPALGNTWVDNVAAGSTDNGWWFEPMMRGPLASNFPDWKPELVHIERFDGNVAHSNEIGVKTYPQSGLRPLASEPNHFKDFKAYRNQFKGLFVFFADNLIIDGGIFADNSIGIEIDNSLSVVVMNVKIIGETETYRAQMARQRIFQPCLHNRAVGIQLNTDGGRTGVTLASAEFGGFEDSRCGNEFPALLDDREMLIENIPTSGSGDADRGDDGAGGGVAHRLGDLPDGLYINCGGDAKVAERVNWESDKYFENGQAIRTRPLLPSLYNQYREQAGRRLSYLIPVNDGNYRVSLYWAEYDFSRNNRREFDVTINGETVLEDFDVHARAGGKTKLIKRTFTAEVRNDRELRIVITGTIDNGFLSLLSVEADRT